MRSMMVLFVGAGMLGVWLPSAGAAPGGKPSAAAASTRSEAAARSAPPRVQRLSFGDDVVRAGRDLGGGDVITSAARAKQCSLVRPRLDFIPELIKSAEDL